MTLIDRISRLRWQFRQMVYFSSGVNLYRAKSISEGECLCFLCFELPVFCQNGYLCNSSPFVSWSVQRGSPKQLCTLGASICDLYLCLEEKTSFSIFLILTSQPVYSFQLANVLLQFWVCSSLEAYFREILYNAENIFALSPRTLFCGIFFLKTEQRAVANASSLALVVSF